MNKFYHSLTYRFLAQKGRRKHYFFNLVDRTTDPATFLLFEKGKKYLIQAKITIDNSSDIPTETAKFTYNGIDITLRADACMGKGYPISEEGQAEKRRDQQLDADLGSGPDSTTTFPATSPTTSTAIPDRISSHQLRKQPIGTTSTPS